MSDQARKVAEEFSKSVIISIEKNISDESDSKKYSKLQHTWKEIKLTKRRQIITACVDMFYSLEAQMIENHNEDITNETVSLLTEQLQDEPQSEITSRIILGHAYCPNRPFWMIGASSHRKYCKLSKLYKRTGIVIQRENECKFYVKRDNTNDPIHYGYRRPLSWESVLPDEYYTEESISVAQGHLYQEDYRESVTRIVLEEINATDDHLKSLVWHVDEVSCYPFVGRTTILSDINRLLGDSATVVVYGVSGVGKSQLALKCAESYRESHCSSVILLDASSEASLVNSVNRVCDIVKVPHNSTSLPDALTDIINSKVLLGNRCLIIFDDVSSYDDLRPLLPSSYVPGMRKPDFLITTTQDWVDQIEKDDAVHLIHLDHFEPVEAREFLDRKLLVKLGKDELAQRLDCFPLLMNHVVEETNRRMKPIDLVGGENQTILYNILKTTMEEFEEDGDTLGALYTLGYMKPKYILPFVDDMDVFEKHLLVRKIPKTSPAYYSTHVLYQQCLRHHLEINDNFTEESVLKRLLETIKPRLSEGKDALRIYIPHAVHAWGFAHKYPSLVEEFLGGETSGGVGFLHLICKRASSEVVWSIADKIDLKVNLVDDIGRTPLHYAAEWSNGSTVKLLIRKGADVNAGDAKGTTPLHGASRAGNVENVRILIENCAVIDARTSYGHTPLHYAAMSDRNVAALGLLLDKGADVNSATEFGFTPLSVAVQRGQLAAYDLLTSAEGVDFQRTTSLGETLLHLSTKGGNLDVFRSLLASNRIDVNAQNKDGFTALHKATVMKRCEMAEMILKMPGVKIDLRTTKGKTALDLAMEMKLDDVASTLQKKSGISLWSCLPV